MSKLDELKLLLESKGLWAKKGLGQNFLVDEKALDKIIEAAELKDTDNVIEVGPGTGFLTEKLIRDAGHVTAVELDRDMIQLLNAQFKFAKNFDLIHGDILDIPVSDILKGFKNEDGGYKVVANIPYYITSPVIKYFLRAENRPSVLVFLVQKEVAEKVCGITGRSVITVETELFGHAEFVDIVPRESFYPSPKVDSAILKIRVHDEPLVPESELRDFMRIVKFGFSMRRKKLANSLSAGLHKKPPEVRAMLEEAGIGPEVRAEELHIEDWKRLLVLTKEL